MIRRYFLLGLRTLLKRKLYSFINIAGLSLALACSLVCFAFVSFFYEADQFHTNVEKLFTVQSVSLQQGIEKINGQSPLPLAEQLSQLSQVESVVRVNRKSGLITIDQETFEDTFTFADKDFFDLFTFPLEKGDIRKWGEPSSIILDHSSAIKYFGDRDPIGQSVVVRLNDANGKEVIESFTVTGIAKEFPKNASFRFKMLLPFTFQNRLGISFEDWRQHCDATMILVKGRSDVSVVSQFIDPYVSTYNTFHPDFPLERLQLEPLTTASLNSYKVDDDVFAGAPKFVFVILIVISFFLIVMACFNYMNIAIAMASFRLKEIGVRKVMGSTRIQLIKQFIIENVILCSLSLFLGLTIAHTAFVPAFSSYFGLSLWLDYSNPNLWFTCLGLIGLAAIGGAGYPALYISSFQPVQVLKDKTKIVGKSLFRRSLLSFQFFLCYVSITTALAFILNTRFQREKDWGYDKDEKVIVKVEQAAMRNALVNNVIQQPTILQASGSVQPFGSETAEVVIESAALLYTVDMVEVGTGYPELMGLTLTEGNSFSSENEESNSDDILVNETLVKTLGLDQAVGKSISLDDKEYTIIGVLQDFHFEPFTELIKPLLLRHASEGSQRYIAFHYASGEKESVKALIKSTWKDISPEKPLIMYEQSSVFDNAFRSFDTATNVMKSAALVTVFIGVFGLFGLSSLTLSSKMKELALRKVMGSNVKQLGWVLNKEIIWLLVIACVLGIPISFLFLKSFLLNVSMYVMPLEPSLFIVTLLMMILVALLSVSFHLYRLTQISPAKHLRDE